MSFIKIDIVTIAQMAIKYTTLYPNEGTDWKHFGLERVMDKNKSNYKEAFPTGERVLPGIFEIIDKEKFLWVIMSFDFKYTVYECGDQ
jgi:hypothetical protein